MKRSPSTHGWPPVICLVLILLNFIVAIEAQGEVRQPTKPRSPVLPEVLTLKEVARLLRVSPKTVAKLARENRIPARLIGDYWRFSRTATLDWLQQKDASPRKTDQGSSTSGPKTSKPRPEPKETTIHQSSASEKQISNEILSKPALLEITGRGPTNGSEQKTIGEKKEVRTAEEISLRGQQVLLKPQQLTLELDLSYTRSEQGGLTVLPIGAQTFIANSQGKQDLFISQFVARYGLPYNLLAVASLPLVHDRRTVTATVPGTSVSDKTTNITRTETRDLFLALRHTTVKEGVGYPEVILSLQTLIPTHKSSFGIGGGVTLIKRIDPVALFASANYTHVFAKEFNDVTRLQAENIFSIDYGFAFSINDRLAMSTSLLGTFTGRSKFDNAVLDSVERFFLRTSLTALLTEKMFVEPFVSFSLNGNNVVSVGLNIPYTFDIAPLLAKVFP